MIIHDLEVPAGGATQTVRWYDAGPSDAPMTVVWHHGTPNIGEPPAPLLEASAARGIRWLGFDRPGYGGSSEVDNWSIADAAGLAALVADAAGVETFAAVGHSGGGAHALACGALLGDRVSAVVSVSGLAPFGAEGLDWFAGMYPGGEAELRAAVEGAPALQSLLEASDFDPEMFTPADHAALAGEWRWFNGIAAAGSARGLGGMIQDDLASVAPWGFELAQIKARALMVHGADDRMVPVTHGRWNAAAIAGAELWVRPGAGHISALNPGVEILDWLAVTLARDDA